MTYFPDFEEIPDRILVDFQIGTEIPYIAKKIPIDTTFELGTVKNLNEIKFKFKFEFKYTL